MGAPYLADPAELRKLLWSAVSEHVHLTQIQWMESVDWLIAKYDVNNDGVLSFEEFVALYRAVISTEAGS